MARFLVSATAIQNYLIEIEADSEQAAMEAAEYFSNHHFDEFDKVGHEFTIDSAELMREEED